MCCGRDHARGFCIAVFLLIFYSRCLNLCVLSLTELMSTVRLEPDNTRRTAID